jgi:hypothetical protein
VEKEKNEAIAAVTREMEQKKADGCYRKGVGTQGLSAENRFPGGYYRLSRKKVSELKTEVNSAMKQVHQIAEKAIEGASPAKAFTSVKEIALEQAKKPEITGKAEG